MTEHYFKIAWRNLIRNKAHSFINLLGLSVGMAVAIMIGLWIYDELSFDKDNPNYNRIAQVEQNVTNNGEVQTWQSMPYPLAAELRKSYGSDFKYVIMGTGIASHTLNIRKKTLAEVGGYFEPQIAEMLALKMLQGNRKALNDPSAVLISATTAKAYFGYADPMNNVLKIDNQVSVKVAGVYADMPKNSTFNGLAFIAPWQLYYNNSPWIKTLDDPWRPNGWQIFVQLADNANVNQVSLKIRDLKLHKVNSELAQKKPALFLQPMNKWHLSSEFKNGTNIGGRIQYVWLFGIIGIFVLLLACINFMNLSTARSEKRAREVGIRKVVGSIRLQLICQFFSESLLFVIIAFAFSLLFVQWALPFFNQVAGKSMSILWDNAIFWLLCISFCLTTGLIAGSYPALYLSSFQPVKVLKGTFRVSKLAIVPRKVLVVVQFTVSVILIIGTIVVFRQIQFAKNRPVGYTRDGLVTVPVVTTDIHNHFETVKDELFKTGVIINVSEAGTRPTEQIGTSSGFNWENKDPNLSVDFPVTSVSYDYGKTVAWQIKAGRDFSRSFLSDSSALIINETAASYMELKDPVGSIIKWYGKSYKVIGVTKDIIAGSPYEQVKPCFCTLMNDAGAVVVLKLNPHSSISESIDKISAVFRHYNPSQPFEYQFVDEEYARKFGDEERIGKLASVFASLAIFISCLGLFGMASFMAEQRIKEIGVRKLLGASVFNLWRLLSIDFIRLVVISIMIATPVGYLFMHNWLQHYQYHSVISWWIFALTGLGSIMITLLAVSYQSIKAALANPVKSLKSE